MTGAVVVEIEDIMDPATFGQLPDAVETLWNSLRALPLGYVQYAAYEFFFGDGAVERVQEFLERDGAMVLSFAMAGRSHAVHVRPAAAPARSR